MHFVLLLVMEKDPFPSTLVFPPPSQSISPLLSPFRSPGNLPSPKLSVSQICLRFSMRRFPFRTGPTRTASKTPQCRRFEALQLCQIICLPPSIRRLPPCQHARCARDITLNGSIRLGKSSFTYSSLRRHPHITSFPLSRARGRNDNSIHHECLTCSVNDLFTQQRFVRSVIDMAALLSVDAKNITTIIVSCAISCPKTRSPYESLFVLTKIGKA